MSRISLRIYLFCAHPVLSSPVYILVYVSACLFLAEFITELDFVFSNAAIQNIQNIQYRVK